MGHVDENTCSHRPDQALHALTWTGALVVYTIDGDAALPGCAGQRQTLVQPPACTHAGWTDKVPPHAGWTDKVPLATPIRLP